MDGIESRFFCPNFCGRSYKRNSAMKQHLRFECGIEPKFECYVCLKKFSLKGSLTKHLVTVHKIVDFKK